MPWEIFPFENGLEELTQEESLATFMLHLMSHGYSIQFGFLNRLQIRELG